MPYKHVVSSRQPSSWALPDRPTCSKGDMTLTTFYNAFCGKNDLSTRSQDLSSQLWDVILHAFKHYVQKYWGSDSINHISTAMSRTKLDVPKDLMAQHLRNLVLENMESSNAPSKPKDLRKRALEDDSEISGPVAKQIKTKVTNFFIEAYLGV